MQYFKFIVISIAFLVAINLGYANNFNSLSVISKNKDSLKLVHTISAGAKVLNSQKYGKENFAVQTQYELPALDLFYSLSFVKKKKKFIALNAIVSYYNGNVNWVETWHGTITQRYYGDFQFIRSGIGITRFRKLSKSGSLCIGLGGDISAAIYSNRVDYYSWKLVSNSSGYTYDIVNSTRNVNEVLARIRVFWKAELVKHIKITNKLSAMAGLKVTLSRPDFSSRFIKNPSVCGGLNLGICF